MSNYKLLSIILILTSTLISAEELFEPLKDFFKEFETLSADFTQTLLNEDGEQIEKMTVTFYLQQPNKFNWHYKEPYVQKIITNGKVLWMLDEDLEQLTVRNFDSDIIEKTPAAIILGNSKFKKHFIQRGLGKIEGFDWVELVPRDLDAYYKNIRVGFDASKLGMMIITDNLDQTTRIDFDEVKKNIKMPSGQFDFEIPANIDVIDERLIENY